MKRAVNAPYCNLCSKWAEVPDLLSEKWRQKRQSQGYAQDGPLLAAILKAEQSTGAVPQHPKPKTPGPLPPDAMKHSFGHATGVCPKDGCGLRAGSRSSRTHCCRRCEMAHLHGKPRLDKDPGPGPTTGEVWKKAHGPECTGHADRKMRAPVASRQPPQPMTIMPSVPEVGPRVPPPPPPYPPEDSYSMQQHMNQFGGQGGQCNQFNQQQMVDSLLDLNQRNAVPQNYQYYSGAQYPNQYPTQQ